MPSVNGLTAEHMAIIRNDMIVSGEVVGTDLILTKYDSSNINAGAVIGPAGPDGTFNTFQRKTASYDIASGDEGTFIEMNVAGANTLNVGAASVPIAVGQIIQASQYGAGVTTVTSSDGVSLLAREGAVVSYGQYARFKLEKVSDTEWYLSGDLHS